MASVPLFHRNDTIYSLKDTTVLQLAFGAGSIPTETESFPRCKRDLVAILSYFDALVNNAQSNKRGH